jgi:hypothetical protein
MKILVTTQPTKPTKSDYNFTTGGEVVRGIYPDAFIGSRSHKASSTALVVETCLTEKTFTDIVIASMHRAGFAAVTHREIAKHVEGVLRLAKGFDVGDVVVMAKSQVVFREHREGAEYSAPTTEMPVCEEVR